MAALLIRLAAGASLASMCLCATAGADTFYTDSDRPGYWWKKDPVAEEQPAPEKKRSPQKQEKQTEAPVKERRYPKLSDYSMQELYDMYPDDFQSLLDDFQKQAVQKPTKENVKGIMTMRDVARRKAAAYANVEQVVRLENSGLSLERDYPMSGPGKEVRKQLTQQEVAGRISAARDKFALIYFRQDGCQYCVAQEQILSYFVASRGWTVKPVDMRQRPDMAARFNITIAPSIILIKQGESMHLPMSSGVISLDELDGRVYNGIRYLNREIAPEQFGVMDHQRGGGLDPLAPLR